MNIWQLARVGDLKKFKSVVKGKSVHELNETDQFGFTCFHWAAQKGEDGIVALLTKREADLDVVDGDLQTPLHWAIDKGHKAIARHLIEHGAALDIQDKFGHSALHRAAALGQRDVVGLLLRSNANPNLQNQNGWTALHVTCYYAHHKIVSELLSCSRTDVNIPNKDGWTPLHCAAMQGYTELCDLLIRHQANIDFASRDGSTPLHLAVQENREIVVQLLINYGANVNLRNARGRRAVDLASESLKPVIKGAGKPVYAACALFGGEVDKALVATKASFLILPSQQIAASMEAKHFTVELVHIEGDNENESEGDKDGGGKKDKGGSHGSGGKGKGGSGRGVLRRGSKSAAVPRIRGQVTRLVHADEDDHHAAVDPATSARDKGKERRESSGEVVTDAAEAGDGGIAKLASSSLRVVTPRRRAGHMFVATYTPSVAGRYRLTVSYDGEDVHQCPIKVTVTEAVTDPTKCEVVTELEGTRAVLVGKPNSLMIQAKDQLGGNRTVGGDVFDVELIRQERDEGTSKRNILLRADETHARIEDLRDGRYVVWFSIPAGGVHFVDIKLRNIRLPGSPFKVNAAEVLSPGRRKTPRSPKSPKTKASKEGKQPSVGLQLPAGEEKDRQLPPLLSPRSLIANNKKDKRLSTKNAGQFIMPSSSNNDSSSNNESAVWERLGELEQANSELQQKQLEFEREKYDLHKQIAQLQRKLEKRGRESVPSAVPREEVASLQQKVDRLAAQAQEAERELRREQARQRCRVCATNRREMVVLPCLHASFCALCVSRMKLCALCEAPLQGFLRIKPE